MRSRPSLDGTNFPCDKTAGAVDPSRYGDVCTCGGEKVPSGIHTPLSPVVKRGCADHCAYDVVLGTSDGWGVWSTPLWWWAGLG